MAQDFAWPRTVSSVPDPLYSVVPGVCGKDIDDHRRLLDEGADLQVAATLRAVFEVDIERALEQARRARVRPRARHQRRQALHEFQRRHLDVRCRRATRS